MVCLIFEGRCSYSSFSIIMSLVLLVSIFVLCIQASLEGASRPDVVNVGAILSFATINGKVSRIAVKAAQNDINSDTSILGGMKLDIKMHDSNFSGFLGIMGGIFFQCLLFAQSACLFSCVSCSYIIYLLIGNKLFLTG